MGIAGFAEGLLDVLRAVYRGDELTEQQQEMVLRMVSSGTYGNSAEAMRIRLQRYVVDDIGHLAVAGLRRFFSLESVNGTLSSTSSTPIR